jgi:enoyl-CoA hydratase
MLTSDDRDGPAIAGGCVIVAACDRRVISAGPIGLAELAVGVPFPTSALEIMRGLVGPRVQDLVFTARTLTPEQAAAVGLVDDLVTAGELLPRAFEHARTLGALPPGVFAFTKRQLHAPARERINARAADDDAVAGQLWASEQVGEAIRRYMRGLARR